MQEIKTFCKWLYISHLAVRLILVQLVYVTRVA